MIRPDNILLIANQATTELAQKVAAELEITLTEMVSRQFSDGERYHAFPCDISGKDIVIIAATPDDSAHQELVDLIAGCRFWNGRTVNVVIPISAIRPWSGPSRIPARSPRA
jgi:ribose-phosphate pyrophosphokinase